jgi:hypothetical protein
MNALSNRMKRPKPVTICKRCGAPGHNIILANGKCGRMSSTHRCTGINQSAIGEEDWAECPSCETTGYDRNNQCMQCKGMGWLFVDGSL